MNDETQMRLLPYEWIFIGSGQLFASPFVSRVVLYRLYDINCSVLVYHKQLVSRVSSGHRGETTTFKCVVGTAEAVQVHVAASTRQGLNDMATLPSTLVDLSDAGEARGYLGKVALSVEPFALPVSKMLIAAGDSASILKHQVDDTSYHVSSRAPLARLGADAELSTFRCWKVLVRNTITSEVYDINSTTEWSLTALTIDDDWQPKVEMRLERHAV
jgi:hypothetical protein